MIDKEYLRKLADAATEGPWEADYSEENNYAIKSPGTEWGDGYAWVSDPDNAAFIAAAREAVPQLLDQLASAESDRNLTAVALARAVTRADRAEAQVRHLKDKYNEDMEQLRREHDGDMEVLTSRVQAVNDVIDRHVEILGCAAVVPVERLWKVLE